MHQRVLRAVQDGAPVVCVTDGCGDLVENTPEHGWRCNRCRMNFLAARMRERYEGLLLHWVEKGRCTECGHEYTLACPKCYAPNFRPIQS